MKLLGVFLLLSLPSILLAGQWQVEGDGFTAVVSGPWRIPDPDQVDPVRAKLFGEEEQLLGLRAKLGVEPFQTMAQNRDLSWFCVRVDPSTEIYGSGIWELRVFTPSDTLTPSLALVAVIDGESHAAKLLKSGMPWSECWNAVKERYQVWCGVGCEKNEVLEIRKGVLNNAKVHP